MGSVKTEGSNPYFCATAVDGRQDTPSEEETVDDEWTMYLDLDPGMVKIASAQEMGMDLLQLSKAEVAFTKDIEKVLRRPSGPLEVTHNVSPAEVLANLDAWRPAIEKEVKGIHVGVENVVPWYKRKARLVICGNLAADERNPLYTVAAPAQVIIAQPPRLLEIVNDSQKTIIVIYVDDFLICAITPKQQDKVPITKELAAILDNEEELSEEKVRYAQQITGEIPWLAQRVLGYLQRTIHVNLEEEWANTGLVMYCDAAYAPQSACSHGGWLVVYGGVPLLWRSRRQQMITLSTAESELLPIIDGAIAMKGVEAILTAGERQLADLLTKALSNARIKSESEIVCYFNTYKSADGDAKDTDRESSGTTRNTIHEYVDVCHLMTQENLREGLRTEGLPVSGLKDDQARQLGARLLERGSLPSGPTVKQRKYALWLWRVKDLQGRHLLRYRDFNARTRVSALIAAWKSWFVDDSEWASLGTYEYLYAHVRSTAAKAIISVPLTMVVVHYWRAHIRALETASRRLLSFRFDQDIRCHCCAISHIHPVTGRAMICDHYTIRECLCLWFGSVQQFEQIMQDRVFHVFKGSSGRQSIPYHWIVATGVPNLWSGIWIGVQTAYWSDIATTAAMTFLLLCAWLVTLPLWQRLLLQMAYKLRQKHCWWKEFLIDLALALCYLSFEILYNIADTLLVFLLEDVWASGYILQLATVLPAIVVFRRC
ncbi:unnamed protein product [Symbiodinium sp. CCMP2592]|nr:unnamed protein product [Symbiodinium sp. CCMP2592]